MEDYVRILLLMMSSSTDEIHQIRQVHRVYIFQNSSSQMYPNQFYLDDMKTESSGVEIYCFDGPAGTAVR